jgi:hypothetical protein
VQDSFHAGVFGGVEQAVGERVVPVGVRRLSELLEHRAGHHGVLVVTEEFLEVLGLPVQVVGRFADHRGDDLGHVPDPLAGLARLVQGGVPVRSGGQSGGGVKQAVQLAEGLGDTPGQLGQCGPAGPLSQRGLVQQLLEHVLQDPVTLTVQCGLDGPLALLDQLTQGATLGVGCRGAEDQVLR